MSIEYFKSTRKTLTRWCTGPDDIRVGTPRSAAGCVFGCDAEFVVMILYETSDSTKIQTINR